MATQAKNTARAAAQRQASEEAHREASAARDAEAAMCAQEQQRKAALRAEMQAMLDTHVSQQRSRSAEKARQDAIERQMYANEALLVRAEEGENRARNAAYRQELWATAQQQRQARQQRARMEQEIERQLLNTFRDETDEDVRSNKRRSAAERAAMERAWASQTAYRQQRERDDAQAVASSDECKSSDRMPAICWNPLDAEFFRVLLAQ
jgi:colicin import membrane protein